MELSSQAQALLVESSAKEKQQFKKTSAYIDTVLKNSNCFKAHIMKKLPEFDQADIEAGRELGRGEFSIVSEITHISSPRIPTKQITCQETLEDDNDNGEGDDIDEIDELSVRMKSASINKKNERVTETFEETFDVTSEINFMSRECLRHGIARYAIKRIKPNLSEDKKIDSIIDLALESKFLAILSHPNIIHMRGMGLLPCHSSFFIVLDRLYETLGEKILRWKEIAGTNTGFIAKRKKGAKAEKKQLWADRVMAAFDISRALRYLHGQRIVYRDLKPENIGFDVRGDAKIFDFGLAKEMNDRDLAEDGLYKMSGLTGSRRYMAPEVVLCKPYNEKADVFSFSILLWEICALDVPFQGYDAEKHARRVVRQNERLKINQSWPVALQDVIEESWSPTINVRPSFERICALLGHEASNFVENTNDVMDRSMNMMDSSNSSRRESMLRSSGDFDSL